MRIKLILVIALSAAALAITPAAGAVPTPLPQLCVVGPAPSMCPASGVGLTGREAHAHGNPPYASAIPTIVESARGR